MSILKIDERLEKAVNAFFEKEPDPNRFELEYAGQHSLAFEGVPFTEKADKWLRILRSVFLFGPGTFILFVMTVSMVLFYPTLGFKPQGMLLLIAAAFLTYAGSGSLKDVKNLAVPGAVLALALVYCMVSYAVLGGSALSTFFWYSIYFVPLVWIVARLARSWASEGK